MAAQLLELLTEKAKRTSTQEDRLEWIGLARQIADIFVGAIQAEAKR